MLETHDVSFVHATTDPLDGPSASLPEIAFVGRSNVGKSSLLNTLCRRRRLAHTSRTPGKTQTINYYAVGNECHFVDLPGYGYAAVPEHVHRSWQPMIEGYLENNPRLRGVVSLVDGRHPPTDLDRQMVGWLAEREIPTLVVLTKADRVSRNARAKRAREAVDSLGLDPDQVVWFSSRTGEGRNEVFAAVSGLLNSEDE